MPVKDLLNPGFWLFTTRYLLNSYRINRVAFDKLGGNKGAWMALNISIREPHNIFLGNKVSIEEGCCIWAGRIAKITIGDNTMLGPHVRIFSSNHGISKNEVMVKQEHTDKDVIIGKDCWLGANSVIVAGVSVGDGTVVAAGAVVTHDTPPYSIVGGVPAKVISYRK